MMTGFLYEILACISTSLVTFCNIFIADSDNKLIA